MEEKLRQFISQHKNDNVQQLALQAHKFADIDLPFALNQIAGWQKARTKLPTWAGVSNIIYPQHLSLEQCSSEFTALYKARLACRLMPNEFNTMVDLTGGFGVDFSFMAPHFAEAVYVEQQEYLCTIARTNFELLKLSNAIIINDKAEHYLRTMPPVGIIYIDPARRSSEGQKTILITDCTPNLLDLKTQLIDKSHATIIKLSPMLDWHRALEELTDENAHVNEVHILSHNNECKELLLVMSASPAPTRIVCINNSTQFAYTPSQLKQRIIAHPLQAGMHLYEPNASIMKAGGYAQLTHEMPLEAIAPNSHLFVSSTSLPNFPGRHFIIQSISSFGKKDLRNNLRGIASANIAVRNFPQTAVELRRKLKLSDGGAHYIFATTDALGTHLLLLCTKFNRKEP